MPVDSFKDEVMKIVSEKQLCSVMNNTKWRELLDAVKALPFPPPYQIKCVNVKEPTPEVFDRDVWYWGDWSDEALTPFYAIEWICVRPTYKKHRGRLIDDALIDETSEFISALDRHAIPYATDNGAFFIYGYKSTSNNQPKKASTGLAIWNRFKAYLSNRQI